MAEGKSNGDGKKEKAPLEMTVRAVILGCILAVIFGAANAYLGLKIGMTVSASIPAAVISMAVLRSCFRGVTILENNMVQAIASSGESLAAGVIFTVPALVFFGAPPSILKIFLIALLGGFLGIFFMIPLRRHLIVDEHGKLPYPEGTACGEILKAGESGGARAALVAVGLLVGGCYKFLMSGLKLWKDDDVMWAIPNFHKAAVGIDPTPALLGVGFIIGPKIAAVMLAGGVLGWMVIIPLIDLIGSAIPSLTIAPATVPIAELGSSGIWKYYIRYIGAGAVAVGGIVSILKIAPIIFKTFRGFRRNGGGAGEVREKDRTDTDLPMIVVFLGALATAIVIFIMLQCTAGEWVLNAIASLIVVAFGFLFVTVAARIVGIVGSSSSPVSGMTLTTLFFTCLILMWLGWSGESGMIVAMTVGAIVCIAVCMAGDISQDLKTGYLVGATPWKLQIAELIGVIVPALIIGWTLYILQDTYGYGEGKGLKAPQATMMHMVVKGMMEQTLPWTFVVIGVLCGVVVELLGVPSLPFAIGLYLPVGLSVPIFIGGVIFYIVKRGASEEEWKRREDRGILFSSGLIAGDALLGIAIAFLTYMQVDQSLARLSFADMIFGPSATDAQRNIVTALCFLVLAFLLVFFIRRRSAGEGGARTIRP